MCMIKCQVDIDDFVEKADFDDKIKHLDKKKYTSNKTKHIEAEK